MREHKLNTVCEEAACPNIGECWTKKHRDRDDPSAMFVPGPALSATSDRYAMPVDALEPQHTADAAAKLGLQHIVVTSVDRDDLADGGASQFVKVIEAVASDDTEYHDRNFDAAISATSRKRR